MPAAAVIPAPIAYIKFVAVKKLVVGFRGSLAGPLQGEYWSAALPLESPDCFSLGVQDVYCEKIIECSTQAIA